MDPSVTDHLGRSLFEGRGRVSRQAFQRWAAAVGDLNPIHFDDDAARVAGYREAVMPPLYISLVCGPVNSLADLKPDCSQAADPMESIALPDARLMAAGDDLEVLEPVYAGDEIYARCSVLDVTERAGSQGAFVVVEFLWEFHKQLKVLVSRSRTSIILR
jgi:acyl dehydratase